MQGRQHPTKSLSPAPSSFRFRPERKGDGYLTREPALKRIRASDLFDDEPWIVIEHGDVEYRLHITRLGKLILTK